MEKNIIKIQRFIRIKKLNDLFNLFEKNNLYKSIDISFDEFTKIITSKKTLCVVDEIINNLSKLSQKKINIKPQIILTGFLVRNFPNDIIGKYKDRHPIDTVLLEWCTKLVKVFKKSNKYNDYNLLSTFIINYNEIFINWKNIDKNRTIQNIIVSYYNRMEHLEKLSEEEMNNDAKDEIKKTLEDETKNLLTNILLIDPEFDIKYLKSNYKKIYDDIKNNMSKIYNAISVSFKKAYLDYLVENFKDGNNEIIYNLILETNKRIVTLAPERYKNSIKLKFESFNYNNMLIYEELYTFINYFKFLFDTIINLSSSDSDNIHIFNELINKINQTKDDNYYYIIPLSLIESNNKIDEIFHQISLLI